MILDIKYYIITIIAIFISLGIGIFIGFNINGQELFLEQQQQIVNSLEHRFNELKLEKEILQKNIEILKAEKNKKENFIEKSYYEIIDKKLSHLNIAILQTTEHYYYNNLKETLEEAGANIPLHLIFTDKIIYLSIDELKNINDFLGLQLTRQQILKQINTDIIDLLIHNKKTALLNFLIDKEFIKFIHYDKLKYPIDQVVIAGGSYDEDRQSTNIIDLGLIEELRINHIRTIGVERLDVIYSSVPLYKTSGISTIDNVDTILGRIALVLVASGRDGYFGEKSFSEELAPFKKP